MPGIHLYRTHVLLLFILSLWIFSSCTSAYLPNAATTDFFENKGDLNASVMIGTNGYDGQVSAAFSDHLFASLAGTVLSEDSSKVNYEDFVRHSYYEGGLGFYQSFSRMGRITFQAGMGRGNIETVSVYLFFGDHAVPGKGTYNKYFFQNTIGFTTKIVDWGANIRYNYVNFYDLTLDDKSMDNVNNHFIEPTLFVRIGWKNIRYRLQYSIIYGLEREPPFEYDRFRLNIGVHFNFSLFSGKDKTQANK